MSLKLFNRRSKKQEKAVIKDNKFVKYILLFLILLLSIILIKFFLRTKIWNGENKVVIAIEATDEGDILVSSINPVAKEIVNIIIPQNTEVEVAGNLGKWKIGKVWDLGKKENRNGELLASTITSYFSIPVTSWGSSEALSMVQGEALSSLAGIYKNYDTNLSIGDRIAITLFSLSLDNVQRTTIDLKKTPILKAVSLEDGTEGYKLTTLPAPKIYSYFVDYEMTQSPTRVYIINKTDNSENAESVAKVIQVLGGGVASINNLESGDDSEFICKVGPAGDKKANIISAVFGCEPLEGSIAENYDLEIVLGNKYPRYY